MNIKKLRAASARGKVSENNARMVLKQLSREGAILGYRQTPKFSPDDLAGIDFYFSIKVSGKRIEVPLQVKSSIAGIIEHQSIDGGSICAVNGQAKDLKQQIESIIKDYRQSLRAEEEPQVNTLAPVEIQIDVVEGQPLTSSKNVAEVFRKEHRNVLQSIENLDCSDDFRRLNFQQTSYEDSFGRSQKMHLMTQDGWAYLVMGFTGQKAGQFKEAYIKKFNELKQKAVQPLALSGDFGALLIQAGQQIQEQNLMITSLKQEKETLAVTANQLAMDNIAISHMIDDKHLIGLREAAKIFRLFGDDPKPLTVTRAMIELGWIYKLGKDSPNLPKSNLEAKGFFKVVLPKCNGEEREQTKLTPQGMKWAYPKLCEHFGKPMDTLVHQYIQSLISKQEPNPAA